jgi:hypothetical protein
MAIIKSIRGIYAGRMIFEYLAVCIECDLVITPMDKELETDLYFA